MKGSLITFINFNPHVSVCNDGFFDQVLKPSICIGGPADLHVSIEISLLASIKVVVDVDHALLQELEAGHMHLADSESSSLSDANLVEQSANLHALNVLDEHVVLLHGTD